MWVEGISLKFKQVCSRGHVGVTSLLITSLGIIAQPIPNVKGKATQPFKYHLQYFANSRRPKSVIPLHGKAIIIFYLSFEFFTDFSL